VIRRQAILVGAAAVAAAAAGIAVQAVRSRRTAAQEAAVAEQTGGFWTMSFPSPTSGAPPVAMAAFRGQPLLLNFWGTWCPPCVKEMPELDQFAREFGPRGWRVVGLAVDNPTAVREFLQRTPVSYTIGLAGFEGAELAKTLGNQQAGLPFTVAFDAQGLVSHRKTGATTLAELRGWV
jgi:thiol-disulfide isomerase/thioredoxin